MTDRRAAVVAWLDRLGWRGAGLETLPSDASFRRYHRVRRNGRSAIVMDAPPALEDVAAFRRLAGHLRGLGYSAPAVLAADAARGLLLLEDMGDDTYTRLLAQGEDEAALYRLATDLLIDLHGRPAAAALPPDLPPYDDASFVREADLLVEWYLPAVTGAPADPAAAAAFRSCWPGLLRRARAVPETLVLRDYHVDNLMRVAGRPGVAACGLLDFQDAAAGPVTYDLASLLEDARRDVPAPLARAMRDRYLAAFPALDVAAFDLSCAVLAAQRHCTVIGIFTRLCRRDGKPDYLRHIPRLWRLLERAAAQPGLEALAGWLAAHVPPDARSVPPCRPAP